MEKSALRQYENDAHVPKWLKLYKAGLTTGQIAKEYKVTPQTVAYRLKKAGVFDSTFRPRTALTQAQKDEMLSLFQQGHSRIAIGKLIGLHESTVARYLKSMGYGGRTSYVGEPSDDVSPNQLNS